MSQLVAANKNECRLAAKLMPHTPKLKSFALENLVADNKKFRMFGTVENIYIIGNQHFSFFFTTLQTL